MNRIYYYCDDYEALEKLHIRAAEVMGPNEADTLMSRLAPDYWLVHIATRQAPITAPDSHGQAITDEAVGTAAAELSIEATEHGAQVAADVAKTTAGKSSTSPEADAPAKQFEKPTGDCAIVQGDAVSSLAEQIAAVAADRDRLRRDIKERLAEGLVLAKRERSQISIDMSAAFSAASVERTKLSTAVSSGFSAASVERTKLATEIHTSLSEATLERIEFGTELHTGFSAASVERRELSTEMCSGFSDVKSDLAKLRSDLTAEIAKPWWSKRKAKSDPQSLLADAKRTEFMGMAVLIGTAVAMLAFSGMQALMYMLG